MFLWFFRTLSDNVFLNLSNTLMHTKMQYKIIKYYNELLKTIPSHSPGFKPWTDTKESNKVRNIPCNSILKELLDDILIEYI